MIRLQRGDFGSFVVENLAPDGTVAGDLLVQLDWDYPGIAGAFGWSLRDTQYGNAEPCDHSGTDGTIACPDCGIPAGSFIADAAGWISDHFGATADDPGYFE